MKPSFFRRLTRSPEAKPRRWQTLLLLAHVPDALARLRAERRKPKGGGK